MERRSRYRQWTAAHRVDSGGRHHPGVVRWILVRRIGFEDVLSQLQQAMEDETVRAVVLRINSPGGEVVASDEIYWKIKQLQEQGKPVVASMGGMAASGGYYIAAAADRIVANPNTLTGSIGVIFQFSPITKGWPIFSDTRKPSSKAVP